MRESMRTTVKDVKEIESRSGDEFRHFLDDFDWTSFFEIRFTCRKTALRILASAGTIKLR